LNPRELIQNKPKLGAAGSVVVEGLASSVFVAVGPVGGWFVVGMFVCLACRG
jgi:hypothetical protein